jgi:hypothetical protein
MNEPDRQDWKVFIHVRRALRYHAREAELISHELDEIEAQINLVKLVGTETVPEPLSYWSKFHAAMDDLHKRMRR